MPVSCPGTCCMLIGSSGDGARVTRRASKKTGVFSIGTKMLGHACYDKVKQENW